MGRPRSEPEPRVLTADVQTVLNRVIRPDQEDSGESVALIASKADTSTRTVYRVLDKKAKPDIALDLADRLCLAADAHISECRIVDQAGQVVAF